MIHRLTAALLFGLSLNACQKSERDLITAYAWSDDDSRQVYARSQWTFEMGAWPDGRRREEHKNARFSILAQNPDGSNRQTLVDWRGGGVFRIYDMRQAGYILTRVDTGPYADSQEYTLFFDDGRIKKIDYFERNPICGDHLGVPSPDGAIIAIRKMVVPENASDVCPTILSTTVRIIDAATQNEIDTLTYSGMQGDAFHWSPEGHLIYDDNGWKAWRGPGDIVDTPESDCYEPRTTSSDVSATGIVIETGSNIEDQPLQVSDWTRPAFGCE